MFVHAISSNANRTVVGNIIPEVVSRITIISCRSIILINTLKTNVFRHLCVRMFPVEERGIQRLHPVQHRLMTESLGSGKVFPIPKQLISIEQTLIHSTMFPIQHGFHIRVRQLRNNVNAPVSQLMEKFFRGFILTI